MYIFSHIFNRPFYRQCPEFIKCGQFRSEVFCVFPHAIRGAIDKNFDAPGHCWSVRATVAAMALLWCS